MDSEAQAQADRWREEAGASGGGFEVDDGCSHCGDQGSISQDYLKAFGVLICCHCKREEQLIAKVITASKEQISPTQPG